MKLVTVWLCTAVLLACDNTQPEPSPVPESDRPAPAPEQPEQKTPPSKEGAVAKAKAAKAEREATRKSFEHQLELTQEDLDGTLKIAAKNPDVTLGHTRAAGLYLTRARLTGNYEDYAKAEALIEKAFTVTKGGYGPFMTRASLNFTLHRLPRVDADFAKHLKKPGKKKSDMAADGSFAAKLAAQRGEYDKARKFFEGSLELAEGYGNLTAYAVFVWKLGEFDKAEELFNKALSKYHGKPTEPIAWVHLMLGLMDLDRGRYDDALAHYKTAESFITGYWLIDEHVAEILTLQGKTDEAKALYLDIIERTNSPEFMDAMAGIHDEAGDEDKAKEYVARARKRYEEQMALFPEAAYGHALDHYLEFGDDPALTLDLAQKNHTLRANAEAKAKLAQAQVAAGKLKPAKKTITAAVATPYSSGDFHLTAAEVFAAVGDDKRSTEQLAKAKTINPKAELAAAPPEG